MGFFKRSSDQSADNTPAPAAVYRVMYKGGLAALPKAKVGGIDLAVWPDRFDLAPTTASRKFWEPLTIPYAAVQDVRIVQRQVGTGEAILAGNNARNLAQNNNIHIHYADQVGQQVILRVEMLTGVTVQGQAKKAAEFNDLLQTHGIRRLFAVAPAPQATGGGSLADELTKLQQLRAAGVLTDDQFEQAKARLLG